MYNVAHVHVGRALTTTIQCAHFIISIEISCLPLVLCHTHPAKLHQRVVHVPTSGLGEPIDIGSVLECIEILVFLCDIERGREREGEGEGGRGRERGREREREKRREKKEREREREW